MTFLRALLAFVVLTLAGLNGFIAGSMETCTGNAPDSLLTFVITLPLNLAGMALLCWKPHYLAVILAAAIPALLSLSYIGLAFALLGGTPACTVITGDPQWSPTGEEAMLGTGWAAAALILWIGLAYGLARGYRRAHDRDHNPSG